MRSMLWGLFALVFIAFAAFAPANAGKSIFEGNSSSDARALAALGNSDIMTTSANLSADGVVLGKMAISALAVPTPDIVALTKIDLTAACLKALFGTDQIAYILNVNDVNFGLGTDQKVLATSACTEPAEKMIFQRTERETGMARVRTDGDIPIKDDIYPLDGDMQTAAATYAGGATSANGHQQRI